VEAGYDKGPMWTRQVISCIDAIGCNVSRRWRSIGEGMKGQLLPRLCVTGACSSIGRGRVLEGKAGVNINNNNTTR